jgi:hypothetical protein
LPKLLQRQISIPAADHGGSELPRFGGLHPTNPSDPLFSATLSLSRFSSLSIYRISLSLDLSSQSHSLPLAVSVFGQQNREETKKEERRIEEIGEEKK